MTQTIRRMTTGLLAAVVLATGLATAPAATGQLGLQHAQAACSPSSTNRYKVIWKYAGVYDGSYHAIKTKHLGDIVTGPHGLYLYTKDSKLGWLDGVYINGNQAGYFMRDDALQYLGCS